MGLYIPYCTVEKIIKNFTKRGTDATFGAVAIFTVDQLIKPANSGIVHCFSNIESKIKSAMIASSKNKHEFSRFMLCFADLEIWIFFNNIVRIKESCFMS